MHRWLIPAILFIFALISIVTLKSVAAPLATSQLIFFIVGSAIFFFASQIPFQIWLQYRWLGYGLLNFLLFFTLALGAVTRGTTSWIPIGSYHLQPSQLAVPLVALVTAYYFQRYTINSWKKVGIVLGIILVPALFIIIEPDLGTTVIYLLSLGSLLFIAQTPLKYLLTLTGLGLLAVVFSWIFVLKPYQKERITSFLGAQSQKTDAHYNAQQSLIAVGSGRVFGRGLGQGVQSHLRFLPERQTDFIFASFAEEWGLMGSLIVISLYLILICYLFYISFLTESAAESYFCITIALMMATQSIVNIGMNVGLLPITGITLPFVSYGGSSLLSLMLTLGITYGISSRLPEITKLKHLT